VRNPNIQEYFLFVRRVFLKTVIILRYFYCSLHERKLGSVGELYVPKDRSIGTNTAYLPM